MREDLSLTLPPESAARIPPSPGPQPSSSDIGGMDFYYRLKDKRDQAWRDLLAPYLAAAEERQQKETPAATRDEEALALTAMQHVQARRLDPQSQPETTIGETLETLANQMRAAALAAP